MQKSERKFYKSASSLPVFNFYQILNNEDLSWLCHGHEIDDDPIQLTTEEQIELAQVWFNITSEYNELFGSKINHNNYITVAQLGEMGQELEIVGTLISFYLLRPSEALKNELEKWKYNPDDLEKVQKKLDGLKFKMQFTKDKNKELFQNPEEQKEKVKHNLYGDVVLLENSMGVTIDVHKTVLEKWVMLILRNDEMIKLQRSKLNK